MANENSLRSYRDFDGYDREGRDREPVVAVRQDGDPLADLARIMGQNETYTDLLKSIVRPRTEPVFEGEGAPEPAAEAPQVSDQADDRDAVMPALPLRGSIYAEDIDWEDLEAELAKHRLSGEPLSAQPADDSLRGTHELWHGEAAAQDELERRLRDEFDRACDDDTSQRGPSAAGLATGVAAAAAIGGAAYTMHQRSGSPAEPAAQASTGAPGLAPSADDQGLYADRSDEAPPRRRGAGMTAIATILGLAVLGGGGIYGYRVMSGSAGTSGEPRVIRADQAPVRVPAQAQDPKPVAERATQGERVVAREERPVSAREQAAQVQEPPSVRVIPLATPPAAPAAAIPEPRPAAASMAAPLPQARGEEPRRVRTVQVSPDGSIMNAPAAPAARPQEPALSVVPVANPPAAATAPRLAATEARPAASAPVVTGTPMPPPRPVQTVRVARADIGAPPTSVEPARPAAPPATAAPPRPLDLGPQQTSSVRTGSTVPASQVAAPAAAGGGTFVQISSHQTEAEARSAFATAQRRFPLLQGQSLNIRSAEIPGRGTWHRVRVGPFSRAEAQSFCERLRGSGGSCVLN